jgi:E3 ubiquitin-protein ligase RNF213
VSLKNLRSFIITAIKDHEAQPLANRPPLWIFLDEINTCEHLGFINSVICHRTLPGQRISSDVYFLAACNPYRLMSNKQQDNIVGLKDAKAMHMPKKLVFRVHPLPQTMMDYVWDFGSLTVDSEKKYINEKLKLSFFNQNPIQNDEFLLHLFVDLVSCAQSFMREIFDESAASMRDVRRVDILLTWFFKHCSPHIMEKPISAIILSLAFCYRCRLHDVNHRKNFDSVIEEIFTSFGYNVDLHQRIDDEQNFFLSSMEVGEGIAKNHALKENIFVLLICILNRLPVFLVGKPGSSKSISLSLIISNMRGKDSKSDFFRSLPELRVFSYQGSESSTSEGILKVFKKAEDLVFAIEKDEGNQQARNELIPLVLLDEVGLAEISPSNPLKVLHSKLETKDDSPLRIAVVGVSNWALDASKMSRAIQLSRPEPDIDELYATSLEIVRSIVPDIPTHIKDKLKILSYDFSRFCAEQTLYIKNANFHGLRDFYSTCKAVGRVLKANNSVEDYDWALCILRNFGGLDLAKVRSSFSLIPENFKHPPSSDLIRHNLSDPNSRYLLLITQGESLLNVVGSFVENTADINNYKIIIGSKFKEDNSENYRYQLLSEIILSMEHGEPLVLYNLEAIYHSLYDMFNQQYTSFDGKKRSCRVALGAFSNPMAHVHDNFKCIVVSEKKKACKFDPPFLNRVEKQYSELASSLNEVKFYIDNLFN